MEKGKYIIPIWLSDWTFEDSRKIKHAINDVVVKGMNKESIFSDKKTVNKVVKKLIGSRKKHTLKPINLTLKSQHGYGLEE
jgi:hypothetical protein